MLVKYPHPLEFWANAKKETFCLLKEVAKSVFSFSNSAGVVENDIGSGGRMVTPNRSSLKRYKVAQGQVITRNYNLVRLDQVRKLSKKEEIQHRPTNPQICPELSNGIEYYGSWIQELGMWFPANAMMMKMMSQRRI